MTLTDVILLGSKNPSHQEKSNLYLLSVALEVVVGGTQSSPPPFIKPSLQMCTFYTENEFVNQCKLSSSTYLFQKRFAETKVQSVAVEHCTRQQRANTMQQLSVFVQHCPGQSRREIF